AGIAQPGWISSRQHDSTEANLASSLRLSPFIFGTTSSIRPAELTPECKASMIRNLPATTDDTDPHEGHFAHTNKGRYKIEIDLRG
ncbi:MAG TPA: hypothetical protein VGH11_05175, partial [Jatrophihabitans sp.]